MLKSDFAGWPIAENRLYVPPATLPVFPGTELLPLPTSRTTEPFEGVTDGSFPAPPGFVLSAAHLDLFIRKLNSADPVLFQLGQRVSRCCRWATDSEGTRGTLAHH
jgi:hypothetical protein